jgi:mannose-6-phosphate isomerase-like protein (cupin superfamily)
MSPSFDLDHAKLSDDPRFIAMSEQLARFSPLNSRESFNEYCRTACELWRDHFPDNLGSVSPRFSQLEQQIQVNGADVIKTGWGGVVVTLHEHPRVEKYLVVNEGRFLALEKHEQKDEQIEVKEGAGLVLWRGASGRPLTVESLMAGKSFHFQPGVEHCVIGTERLLLFERSTDPKGMDQDLIFIFEPESG